MLETHEVLGREVDPIDDLRRKFEAYYTEPYFHPANGDYISDDYYRIIDLSTQPGELDKEEAGKLNRSINRLNEKYALIQSSLGGSSLQGAYNSVAEQINTINKSDASRSNIAIMHSAPLETLLQ